MRPKSLTAAGSWTCAGEQAEAALEHGFGPGGASLGEHGRGDPALGGEARVQVFRLGAVDPALEDAGGEAADDAGGVRELCGREAEQLAGQVGRAEGREQAGRVEAFFVKLTGRDAADPAGDLAAEGDRGDQVSSGHRPGLGQRQRGRDRGAAHVDDRQVVRVVELQRLREGAVGERRRPEPDPLAAAQDPRRAVRRQRERRAPDGLPEIGAEPGQRETDHVQHPEPGARDHVRGQVGKAQARGPFGEACGKKGHRGSP